MAFEDRVLELLETLEAVFLTALSENLRQRYPFLLRAIFQQPAIFDDDDRQTADRAAEFRPPPFQMREDDLQCDESADYHDCIDDRKIVAEQRLLSGFADDEQQDEVE